MAVKIELKRSAVPGKIPTTSSLELGEVAINTYDGKLFFKQDVSGTESIIEVASTSGSVLSASYANYANQANSASYALNSTSASYSLISTTASYAINTSNAISASYALSASYSLNSTSASYAFNATSASYATTTSYADNFTVAGTLTAQKIIVQTITSSTDYVTGSTIFGSQLSNTHQFTGSVSITGSLLINGRDYINTSASFDSRILNNSSSIGLLSSSFLSFSSSYNTGSFTGSFSGSLFGTASYASTASNIIGGNATYIPYFNTDTTLANSAMYQIGSESIAINETNITTANPEALYVFQTNPTSFNVITGKGNLNNYLQLNIQNTNQGISASSDVVATANNGNEESMYVNMGINSENFTGPLGGSNDAYVYSVANNFHIGNASTSSQHLGFFVGGFDVDDNNKLTLKPNNLHELTGSLNISGSLIVLNDITGSLFGTSSYAVTSSYAITSSYALNVTSASYANISSTSSYTLNAEFLDGYDSKAFLLTSSYNAFTASYLIDSSSFSSSIAQLQDFSSSLDNFYVTEVELQAATASLSASISYLSSSYLNSSASFDIRINNNSSSISLLSSSFNSFSSSYNTGSFTGSFKGDGSGLYNISASGIVGLNLSQIASGSVTASVDPNLGFRVNANATISGSLSVTGSIYVNNGITGSLFGTSSWANNAISASYASNTTSASYALSSSYSLDALSASYAQTASYADTFIVNGDITGSNALFTGTITAQKLVVQTVSSSVVYSSGSNVFGNQLSDTQTFTGSVNITGSLSVNGSNVVLSNQTSSMSVLSASYALNSTSASYATNADLLDNRDSTTFANTGSNIFLGDQTITGSLTITGSTVQIGNNTLIGNTSLSGSINVSGSQTFLGNQTLTGSFSITGSTIQIGNNTLIGDTLLSGSITISGSYPIGSYSSSVNIIGDTSMTGYLKFTPQSTNVDTSISASYIFVSGSTNDLYFSQNGNGFSNVTRLRWIEGNLYTGLLSGGLLSATTGSTTFNLSSGSGIIVSLNASINDDPYPTIDYVNWGNYTSQSLTFLTSSVQTFIGVDSGGQITQQNTAFNNGVYNEIITIGTVIHQNKSTINASITYPNVAYGYKQRTYDFVKAFGPLKLSGLNIIPSSSLGLAVSSGTAFADGRNYQVDPNNPSYITDSGTTVSKIFKYYQSGSEFIEDTNGGIGYTVIDPTLFNPAGSGSLTPVPGTGINREWSVQRIFWYPNSATKGIVAYYGTQTYTNEIDAAANLTYEQFQEVENTKQNAVYLGAIALRNNADFTDSTSYRLFPGGIFRNVGGSGGGGNITSLLLSQLGDVTITGPTNNQPLVYDSVTTKWVNKSFISASLQGNADTSTSSSYAITSSYALSATSASYSNNTTSASYALNATSASYAINANNAISASIATSSSYALNADNAVSASYALNTTSASYANNTTSASYALTSSFSQNSTSASYALNSTSASYALNSTSASYAISSSYSLEATSASYALNAISASYALNASNAISASYSQNSTSASYANTSTSASHALNADNALNANNAISASYSQTSSFANTFIVSGDLTGSNALFTGTITAQKLVVQTVSSSIVYSSGSNIFGNDLSNTQVMTGSVSITGSLSVNNSSVILTNQTSSMSVLSASYALNSTSASYTNNATSASYSLSSSYAFNATSASYALNATSASYTLFATSASQSQNALTSSFITGSGVIGAVALATTSSYSITATSSSYAISSSNAISASYAFNATSASYALTSTSSSFSTLATSASYALNANNAISASYAATSSYATNFKVDTTLDFAGTLTDYASVNSSVVGLNNLFTQPTGSFTSAFFKYTVSNGTNIRAGEVISIWNNSSTEYTDYSTVDLGTTNDVTSSASLVAGEIQFNIQTNTSGWKIKSIGTFI